MEKGSYVKDMRPDADAAGIFAVSKASSGTTRTGQPFWNVTLADATGSLEGKIWYPKSEEVAEIPVGCLVNVEGRCSVFRDQVQLGIERFRVLTGEEREGIDRAWLMPASPVPREEMEAELRVACRREFSYGPWKKLVRGVLADADIAARFAQWPAAVSVHHAYVGGLLEHTLSVFRSCCQMADHYPELDRQTLLAGALFHDLGKLSELSCDFAISYTDEGLLLGHIVLGLELLRPHFVKSGLERGLLLHLQHLILSHHGQREFGAVQLPATPEAFALHFADNMDARMAQTGRLFAQMEGDSPGWTPRQKTLGDRSLFRPAHTPVAPAAARLQKHGVPAPVEEQCSLLSKA